MAPDITRLLSYEEKAEESSLKMKFHQTLEEAITQLDETKFLNAVPSYRSQLFLGSCIALASLLGWEIVLGKALKEFDDADCVQLDFNDPFLKSVLKLTDGDLPIMVTETRNLIQLGMFYCVSLGRIGCLKMIAQYYELRLIDYGGNGLVEIACLNLDEDERDEMVGLLISEFETDEKGERVYFLSRALIEIGHARYLDHIVSNKKLFERLVGNQLYLCVLAEVAINAGASTTTLLTMMTAITDQRFFSVHSLLNQALGRGDIELIKGIMQVFGPYTGVCYNAQLEWRLLKMFEYAGCKNLFYDFFTYRKDGDTFYSGY